MASPDTETRHERVARLLRANPQFTVPNRKWFVRNGDMFRADGRAITFGRRFIAHNAAAIKNALVGASEPGESPTRYVIYVPCEEERKEIFEGRLSRQPVFGAFTLIADGGDVVLFQLVAFSPLANTDEVLVTKHRGTVLSVRADQLTAWDGGVRRIDPTPVVDPDKDAVRIVNLVVPGED